MYIDIPGIVVMQTGSYMKRDFVRHCVNMTVFLSI